MNPPPADPPNADEEKARLDRVTKILIGRDIELQKAYDSLEQAYNQVEHEKRDLTLERNKFSIVLSGITDAIIAVDHDKNIATFNQVAETLTGRTQEEVIGKQFHDVITLTDGDVVLNSALFSQQATTGKGIVMQKKSVKITAPGKTPVYADVLVNQLDGRPGSSVGYIVTLHDVSEQKQLEEMKLDFVSMAAHELRTPLTAISGYLAVFIEENKATFNADQLSILNRVTISTKRLHSLVENLLNVSKIERGALTLKTEKVNWIENLKQTVEEFMIFAKEQQVTLEFVEPTVSIPPVNVDVIRINEVLSNLISNAITYTKTGDTVQISVEYKDGQVTTHILDHGPGIPAIAIPHLFTKFFRVSGKLEQGSKGTGLGLFISKAIIQMHKGTIWVDSEEGKGSIFSFSIPIA
ncbi:PAS domain-containing protein [Candidatus Microgenomates bacterium]|nr:PAS domain-containing protein [Candidatus Microgenomates bacterium]